MGNTPPTQRACAGWIAGEGAVSAHCLPADDDRGDSRTKAEAILVATIEAQVRMLDEARVLLSRFQAVIRE
jgi:hypothetical protein